MSVSIVLFPVKYVIVNLIWTVPFGNLKVIQRKICFFFKKSCVSRLQRLLPHRRILAARDMFGRNAGLAHHPSFEEQEPDLR